MTDATEATREFDPLDDDEFPDELPQRPRQRFLTVWSMLAVALLIGAVGFYVGVRVQKSKAAGSSGSSSFSAPSGKRAGFGGAVKSGSSSAHERSFAAAGGGFPGASTSSNDAVGSVSSRNGNTLYVSESGGNTVKVKLSKATTVTKSETVSKGKIFPGDEVTITGAKTSGGLTAITITDSGASSSSSSSSSSSGSSGSSSSSGAVSSLFGG
jgi:hypothetical protein